MKFLIVLLRVLGATATLDRRSLIPDMSEICIYSNVCRRANDTVKTPMPTNTGLQPCCSECSCDDDCEDNCCFPKPESRQRPYQECIFPGTKQPAKAKRHLYQSYYVVNKIPPDGCTCNQESPNTNSANPLGRLSPVLSKESGRIFWNAHLANCFCETEVIPWSPVLLCNTPSNTPVEFHFDELTNPEAIYKLCSMQFYINRDVKSEECFKDTIDSCDGSVFPLPYGTEMTHDDIIKACTSGFFSPYLARGQYANAFCHMCNGHTFKKWTECTDRNFRGIVTDIYGILRNDLNIDYLFGKTSKKNGTRRACPPHGYTSSECREILCPEGQLRGADDKCKMLFSQLSRHEYNLLLELTPSQPVTVADIKKIHDIDSGYDLPETITTPWPEDWHIYSISLVIGVDPDPLLERLVVEQNINALNKSFESITEDIGELMTQTWEIKIGNITIDFKQTFSPRVPTFLNMDRYPIRSQIHEKIEKRKMAFLYSSRYRSTKIAFYITKRFFCEQVKLEKSEYTLTGKTLTYNRTGRTFFDLEFSYPQNFRGESSVRICLDESGLIGIRSGCACIQICLFLLVSTMTTLFDFI